MSVKKTIAFQVEDEVFLAQYEQRQKQSGMKVKDYLISLIEADVAKHTLTADQMPSETPEEAAVQVEAPVSEEAPASEEAPVSEEVLVSEEPIVQQEPDGPVETTNFFVKITKEQRQALEAHKAETGETTGAIINRLVEDFLTQARTGTLDESLDATYLHFDSIAAQCNTTCSAKIPTLSNQELFEYLEGTGRTRNVLMACLVHLELNKGEITEAQGQGLSM